MPYAYLTFAQARTMLASRLQDPNFVYWSQPSELDNCIIESVRLFQALTGSYKQKFTFNTTQSISYYDIPAVAATQQLASPSSTVQASFGYNATDVEIANNVLAALLEPPLTYPTWTGTGQFTLTQLQNAIQNRLNRFISSTGCRVTQQTLYSVPPPGQTVPLPPGTIDVRRCGWIPLPTGIFPPYLPEYPLGRMDEWAEQAYGQGQSPAVIPYGYSVYETQPLQLRLKPTILNEGNLDGLFVFSGPTCNLNPAAPVVLNIPDDLTPGVKWGVLADLLGTDGPSRDYARASYCEQRYNEFVQIAVLYPSVLIADINAAPCGIGSVQDMDFYMPDWQTAPGQPTFVGMAGRNMACVGPTPDVGPYGVGLWMCANAFVPTTAQPGSTTYLQVSRGQIDPILDYAQHIASFKMAGAEFDGTSRMYGNLISCAKNQNGRLEAVAFYKTQIEQPAMKSELQVPRMIA